MQIKLRQLAIITFTWLAFGFLMAVYDHLVLHTDYSTGPAPDYSFAFALTLNLVSALVGALLGGSFLVFHVNVKYADKPYGYTIMAVCLSF